MAFSANPSRSIFRSLAAALCLLSVILLTTPCSMAAQSPAPAMHCADCCDHDLALVAPPFCCASHPQPAAYSAVTSSPAMTRTIEAFLPSAPTIHSRHRTVQIFASPSPPPLRPILRI